MRLNEEVDIDTIKEILKRSVRYGKYNGKITGINEIHKCKEGEIIFVDSELYFAKAINSPAAAIIAPPSFPDCDKHVIVSDNPFEDFCKLVDYFFPENDGVPEFRNIGGAYIAVKNVSIGGNVKIYPGVVIYPNTRIGDNVVIHAGSVIGGQPFYYKMVDGKRVPMPVRGGVIIENDVEIGASVTIDRGVLDYTIIGEGTKIDNLVHIAHDVVIGRNCLIAAQTGIAGNSIIEDEVIIWGQVGITSNVRIGKMAVLYAQSGVYCSLEGDEEYLGSPAEPAKRKWRQYAILKKLPYAEKLIKNL